MKAILLTIVLCFALGWVGDCAAQPFAGQTRNKLVVKQSKRAVKRAAKGNTYYTRYNGKMYRNTRAIEMAKKRCDASRKLTRKLKR